MSDDEVYRDELIARVANLSSNYTDMYLSQLDQHSINEIDLYIEHLR